MTFLEAGLPLNQGLTAKGVVVSTKGSCPLNRGGAIKDYFHKSIEIDLMILQKYLGPLEGPGIFWLSSSK